MNLAKDHANYLSWLEKDTAGRQTAYAAVTKPENKVKTERELGAIVPFTASGTNLVYLPARLIAANQEGRGKELADVIRGLLANFTFTTTELATLTTPDIIEGAHKFKFAKLIVVKRVTAATAKSSSRITGRQYYKHENDSVSAHFGKKVAADTFDSVVTAIKAEAAWNTLFTGSAEALASRYSFVPEGE
ncbi:MAG: hypothetical protein V7K18_08420 [Nostoc sp.]|uniref:hypothetical protein n=1 Tax=Nostoc sp. TaxID=1180 RepID=UPI002FF9D054